MLVASAAMPEATNERARETASARDRRPSALEPLPPEEAERVFRRGVALFNQARYWHAHEEWERLWRSSDDTNRDFYQGLIQVAAGLLHLQRRNARGARNKLGEGLAKLRRYHHTHRGIVVDELIGRAERILDQLDDGELPYLIPPVIKFVA